MTIIGSPRRPGFTTDEVDRDLPKVREIVTAVDKVLDQMSPY